jgi:hypothetical protein
MRCPHCLDSFFPQTQRHNIEWPQGTPAVDQDKSLWAIESTRCPGCGKLIFALLNFFAGACRSRILVQPKGIARAPLSPDVPPEFSADYLEACTVLADSPKASAALSRRCLQHLLREKAGVRRGDLATEIQQVIDSNTLPSHLVDSIDAIRNIGNFGAHPMKSTNSGEIIDVEPGEAEWNLDVLEGLFDFYFVQPARSAAKRAALDKKLAEAGKKPMK